MTGTVLASPTCPGPVPVGGECPPRPLAGVRVQLLRGATVVASTTTDSAGRFTLRVPPGDYTVTAGFADSPRRPTRQAITVPPAGATVSLTVDTGIR